MLHLLAVVTRGLARDALEVLTHKGWVGEVQLVGNLLDRHIGVLEQVLDLENHKLVNPLMHALARVCAHHAREVLRRKVHLVGVELDAALDLVVLVEQVYELLEVVAAAILLGDVGSHLVAVGDKLAEAVDHRGVHMSDAHLSELTSLVVRYRLGELAVDRGKGAVHRLNVDRVVDGVDNTLRVQR